MLRKSWHQACELRQCRIAKVCYPNGKINPRNKCQVIFHEQDGMQLNAVGMMQTLREDFLENHVFLHKMAQNVATRPSLKYASRPF